MEWRGGGKVSEKFEGVDKMTFSLASLRIEKETWYGSTLSKTLDPDTTLYKIPDQTRFLLGENGIWNWKDTLFNKPVFNI